MIKEEEMKGVHVLGTVTGQPVVHEILDKHVDMPENVLKMYNRALAEEDYPFTDIAVCKILDAHTLKHDTPLYYVEHWGRFMTVNSGGYSVSIVKLETNETHVIQS